MFLPFFGESFALGAALCWAIGPLIAYRGVDSLGTFRFSMFRFSISALALFVLAILSGQIDLTNTRAVVFLMFSGIVGVAFGEACLFQSVFLLGPRIASIIFALHAPLTALVGTAIFDETASSLAFVGAALAVIGVYTAIIFRSSSERSGGDFHKSGTFVNGLVLVILAVIFQMAGALLSKEVISTTGPFFASFIRTFSAAVAFAPIYLSFREKGRSTAFGDMKYVVLSALVSTVGGMTLLLAALANTEIFRAVVLASLSPVMYILLMSTFRNERFHIGAWIGTIVAVIGGAITVTST